MTSPKLTHHRNGYTRTAWQDGSFVWRKNNKLHVNPYNGPTVHSVGIYDKWYENGKLHRLDGPAFITADGDLLWYYDGNEYSFDRWITKANIPPNVVTKIMLEYEIAHVDI
jgi:hypothetical protein